MFFLLCGSLLLFGSGCALLVIGAAAGAGAAGVAYVKGDLEVTVEADPEEVAKASEKAFDQLQIRKISSNASALDAQVIGRTATDKKITITAKGEGSNSTKMSIRIGTIGDEDMSRKIYDEIKNHL